MNKKIYIVVSILLGFMGFNAQAYEAFSTFGDAVYVDSSIKNISNSLPVQSENLIGQEAKGSVGANIIFSGDLDVYNIPVGYGFPIKAGSLNGRLDIGAVLPYISNDITKETGVGDILLKGDFYTKMDGMLLKSSISYKLDNGDADLGLGSDSTDFGLSLFAHKRMDGIGYKGGVGYVVRGDAESFGTTVGYGDTLVINAAAEYEYSSKIFLGGGVSYVRTAETDLSWTGGSSSMNGLSTIDLIPELTYKLKKDDELTLKLILPIAEENIGNDGSGVPSRGTSFDMSYMTSF